MLPYNDIFYSLYLGVTWRPYFATYKDLECCIPRFSGLKHFLALLLDYINMKLLDSFLPQFLGVEMLLLYEKEISRCGVHIFN